MFFAAAPAVTRVPRSVSRALSCVGAGAVVVGTLSGCPSLGTLYRDRDDVEYTGDVAYLDDGDPRHKLDLYEPRDAADDAPVVVFVHGGYWNAQDKQFWEFATGLYGNVGVALAREGVRVANVNYRLFPEVKLPGMLDDVAAAVGFVEERYDRPVILMGHSAGAHLAAATALLPGGPQVDVAGLVLVSGVYDIESAANLDTEENRAEIFEPLFGETGEEQSEASVKPFFADGGLPVLFAAGTDDFQSVELDFGDLQESLADDDAVSFVTVDGADHAGTVLQIGGKDDVVAPAVLGFIGGLAQP